MAQKRGLDATRPGMYHYRYYINDNRTHNFNDIVKSGGFPRMGEQTVYTNVICNNMFSDCITTFDVNIYGAPLFVVGAFVVFF